MLTYDLYIIEIYLKYQLHTVFARIGRGVTILKLSTFQIFPNFCPSWGGEAVMKTLFTEFKKSSLS